MAMDYMDTFNSLLLPLGLCDKAPAEEVLMLNTQKGKRQ